MPNRSEAVDRYLATLEHPFKEEVGRLRAVVLAAHPEMNERIKWNAPSFGPRDEDRVTFRLPPKGGLQLIFHRGVKPKPVDEFTFDDETGFLTWPARDRAVLSIRDADDLKAKEATIGKLVARWIEATK
jgi:hypothetical protein